MHRLADRKKIDPDSFSKISSSSVMLTQRGSSRNDDLLNPRMRDLLQAVEEIDQIIPAEGDGELQIFLVDRVYVPGAAWEMWNETQIRESSDFRLMCFGPVLNKADQVEYIVLPSTGAFSTQATPLEFFAAAMVPPMAPAGSGMIVLAEPTWSIASLRAGISQVRLSADRGHELWMIGGVSTFLRNPSGRTEDVVLRFEQLERISTAAELRSRLAILDPRILLTSWAVVDFLFRICGHTLEQIIAGEIEVTLEEILEVIAAGRTKH